MLKTTIHFTQQNKQTVVDPFFQADYKEILKRIDGIDPVRYAASRNYTNGAVTRLSPWISRGVISTKTIYKRLRTKGFKTEDMESLVKELCWRDYFQRVWQNKDIDQDLKQTQEPVRHHQLPDALPNAATGIDSLDRAIRELFATGYMHNHCRMYLSSVTCNIAQSHWKTPALWMYYHLLDGDWASNACSWQWVAGSNSGKKYVANQENINRYTGSTQTGTYLDCTYEDLANQKIPSEFTSFGEFEVKTKLPETGIPTLNPDLPTFVYNYYNMDPEWHKGEPGNRILLLEPSIFGRYPVSENCIEFLTALCRNIPGIQIMTGSFEELKNMAGPSPFYYKEHPLNHHYSGIEESRDWICDEVSGYYPSFFSYWKVVEKHLRKHESKIG
jgi:deoxyribodipyrimidine photo-lyase